MFLMSTPGIRTSGPRVQSPAFSRYFEILVEHVWIVVACVVVVLGATIAYVKLAPKTYTAQAQMLVSPASASDATLFSLPVLHSSGSPTSDVLTAASLVTTPGVADAVIKQLRLKTSAPLLLQNVQATPVGQANLISIQGTGSSATGAARLANAVVRQVVATRAAALHAAIATQLPGLQAQVAALPASQRNGAGSLGAQLAELEQLRTASDPTITPTAPADVPTAAASPNTKLSLVAGLLGGLIIGVGAAFAFHALDPRLRRGEQLREIFDVPTLATIPRERSTKGHRPILYSRMSLAAREGYRTLRTILTSRGAGESRSFLITGSSPSEGKTTSAIALALSLAQTGASVILIEADMRRPTIAATLGLTTRYGIEHVLTGEATLDRALAVATFEGVPVGVLAVHQPSIEIIDHLSLSVAERMIEDAGRLANYVVIDSPPLTAVVDALPLAKMASEVLVVARIGASKLNRLAELRNLLAEQGTYPTGVILVGDSSSRDMTYYPAADPVPPRAQSAGNGAPRNTPPRESAPRDGEVDMPRTNV